jgi:hypothetical protein
MPVTCKLVDGKYRIVGPDGKIETGDGGSPVDGKGHDDQARCMVQARAINASMSNSIVYLPPNDMEDWSLADEKERTYRKELIYVGDFQSSSLRFSVDEELIDHWIATHEALVAAGNEVPLPVEHSTDPEKRRGTVLKLEKGIDSQGRTSLFGYVKFRDAEAERLAGSQVSVYVPPEWTDGKGNKYVRPVRHVALTDYPVIPGLDQFQAIAASLVLGDNTMSLRALAEKLGVDLKGDDGRDDVAISNSIVKLVTDLKTQVKDLKDKVTSAKPPEKKEDDDRMKVAAGFISMAKKSRSIELDRLVEKGKITPAVRKDLEAQYLTDDALALSLSNDGVDGFDALVVALDKNDASVLKEKTGPQTVALSNTRLDPKNPLIADAEARAKV